MNHQAVVAGALARAFLAVQRPSQPPAYRLPTLKATVHNAVRSGGQAQNHGGHPHFRARLGGRIAWLEHVHPAHGAKLRAEFERIDWG